MRQNGHTKYFFISSLQRGIEVFELLANYGSLSVSQVASMLGYNRSAAHRFLSTLKELGYVQQTHSKEYEPTFKILELCTKVSSRFEIRKSASLFMRSLSQKTKETINLGVIQGTDIIHLDKIESTELLRIDPEIGSRAPAQHTALGKAILAFIPTEELKKFCRNSDWTSLTPYSKTTDEELIQELKKIRSSGWAIDNEELCLGLRCIAVPIFDHLDYPRYAISISGPTLRMSEDRILRMCDDLLSVSRELSRRLKERGQ